MMHRVRLYYLILSFCRRAVRVPATSVLCLCVAAVLCGSCSRGSEGSDNRNDEILLIVGDSTLTMTDVTTRIPSGLTPEDSVILFNRIVDTWLRSMLLEHVAMENITDR